MTVKVTAILPTFNAETTIRELIADLAAATRACIYANVELIVVDDASTDSTVSIVCNELALENDKTPGFWTGSVIRQKRNLGVCAARERGLSIATGEFVWFIDSDDRIPPTALLAFLAQIEDGRVDVAVGGSCSIAEGAEVSSFRIPPDRLNPRIVTGVDSLRDLLHGQIRGQLWDKLIRRSLLDATAFSGTKVHSDIPITAAALSAAGTVAYFDELVYGYTVRRGSIIGASKNRGDSVLKCANLVVEKAAVHNFDRTTIQYFEAWFVGLSLLRDLQASNYSENDRRAFQDAAKSAIRPSSIVLALRLREYRRALSFLLAMTPGNAFTGARTLFRVKRRADLQTLSEVSIPKSTRTPSRWSHHEG